MEIDAADSGDSTPPYDPQEKLTEEEQLWLLVEKVLRSLELNQNSIDEASEILLNLENPSDQVVDQVCHMWARFLLQSHRSKKIALIYLANDLVQKCMLSTRQADFHRAF